MSNSQCNQGYLIWIFFSPLLVWDAHRFNWTYLWASCAQTHSHKSAWKSFEIRCSVHHIVEFARQRFKYVRCVYNSTVVIYKYMYSEIYWLTVNTEFEYTIHGASIAVVRLYFICKRRIHSNKEEKKKKNSVHCMSFHVYNPHITRQCHHCDWNDARSVLFTTITIVSISNNSSNDIDDDDIEKIQFATKIETEKEKKHRSIEIAVCRKDDYKFDCSSLH